MTEQEFLSYMEKNHDGAQPLDRFLMNRAEIRLAESLVKQGKLTKGHSTNRQRNVIYYYETTQEVAR